MTDCTSKKKLVYVDQYIFAEDSRNMGVDVLYNLKEYFDIFVFTQARGVGKGFKRFTLNGLEIYAIDLERREPSLYLLDKVFKKVFRVRKFATDIFQLMRFLKQTAPDVIQVESMLPWGLITWFATLFLPYGRNVVVTQHAVDCLNIPFDYSDRINSRIIRWFFRRAYCRFTIRANSYLTAEWLANSGVPRENIRIVPVNIAASFHFSMATKSLSRRRRFISASRLSPMKGIDVLIEAFRQVVDEFSDAVLDIYGLPRNISGVGDYKKYLERLVEKYELENNVFFPGPIERERVPNVLSEYDFHVASSRGETLNLVVAEAASRGVPSIVTQHIGISDWMVKHHCGLVCPCTPEGLHQTIRQAICMDDASYQQMSGNCRNLYDEFTPKRVTEGMLALYREILELDKLRNRNQQLQVC